MVNNNAIKLPVNLLYNVSHTAYSQNMKTQRITIRLSDKEAKTLAEISNRKQCTISELFRAWLRSQK